MLERPDVGAVWREHIVGGGPARSEQEMAEQMQQSVEKSGR